MVFDLDSLQLITHQMDGTVGFIVHEPTYLVVDTYYVPDKRCNVLDRCFIILSDGHHIVRALLTIAKNGAGSVLQLGDIIKINQYNTVLAKDTYIVMISDFYVKHSNSNKPNGFPQWFTINIDQVKESQSLDFDNTVWFTSRIHSPKFTSYENNDDNLIIDNWTILPNGCIAGTAYTNDKELQAAPISDRKTDTHGVSNNLYVSSMATNVVLSLCCPTTLRLDPASDFGSVKELSKITTLSGSSYYLANQRDNMDMNRIIQQNMTSHLSIHDIGGDIVVDLPEGPIERVFTASFLQLTVHNDQFVCEVQLCTPKGHHTTNMGDDCVYLFLPLIEYTRGRDLYRFLNKAKGTGKLGPPKVGDYVSILLRGRTEPTTTEEIAIDKHSVSFITHSRSLQSQYSKNEVRSMRALYTGLNDYVTKKGCPSLSKYDPITSNLLVIRPVVSTTSDPLSQDDSVDTDDEENDEFSCPLHQGGYKSIDYESSDGRIRKKCKLSQWY